MATKTLQELLVLAKEYNDTNEEYTRQNELAKFYQTIPVGRLLEAAYQKKEYEWIASLMAEKTAIEAIVVPPVNVVVEMLEDVHYSTSFSFVTYLLAKGNLYVAEQSEQWDAWIIKGLPWEVGVAYIGLDKAKIVS